MFPDGWVHAVSVFVGICFLLAYHVEKWGLGKYHEFFPCKLIIGFFIGLHFNETKSEQNSTLVCT